MQCRNFKRRKKKTIDFYLAMFICMFINYMKAIYFVYVYLFSDESAEF